MPRRPRIKLAEVPQHVVQRGINREPCFFAEEDYHFYLHWLQKSAADWHCAIHAYVLMTNHVHLLVTSEQPDGIAKLMQSIGRRYVQYINHSYHRTGSLWEGRFKSSLVQVEEYLLTCMRYIELNPVRAAMVADPGGYRWSSYRANGLDQPDARLTPHPLYLALGRDDKERQAVYRELFRVQLDSKAIEDMRLALNQNQPLGNSRFYAKIEAVTGQKRMAKPRGRPQKNHDESPAHDVGQRGLGL